MGNGASIDPDGNLYDYEHMTIIDRSKLKQQQRRYNRGEKPKYESKKFVNDFDRCTGASKKFSDEDQNQGYGTDKQSTDENMGRTKLTQHERKYNKSGKSKYESKKFVNEFDRVERKVKKVNNQDQNQECDTYKQSMDENIGETELKEQQQQQQKRGNKGGKFVNDFDRYDGNNNKIRYGSTASTSAQKNSEGIESENQGKGKSNQASNDDVNDNSNNNNDDDSSNNVKCKSDSKINTNNGRADTNVSVNTHHNRNGAHSAPNSRVGIDPSEIVNTGDRFVINNNNSNSNSNARNYNINNINNSSDSDSRNNNNAGGRMFNYSSRRFSEPNAQNQTGNAQQHQQHRGIDDGIIGYGSGYGHVNSMMKYRMKNFERVYKQHEVGALPLQSLSSYDGIARNRSGSTASNTSISK